MTRPLRILEDPGTAYVQDGNGNNYPMQVVPRDKWNTYSNRSNVVTSNFPGNVMFYDPQYPLGVINIIPFPNATYTMFWDSYLQLEEFPSLTTPVTLPPGYNAALRHNLCLELKPFFTSANLSPEILTLAMKSRWATSSATISARLDRSMTQRSSAGRKYRTTTSQIRQDR